jgi:hypothetical protein
MITAQRAQRPQPHSAAAASLPACHYTDILTRQAGGASVRSHRWQWQLKGSPDGAMMNECAIAALPNNTLVMNARNYIGQHNFTVKRAIMWSHDEGDSCESDLSSESPAHSYS